MDLYGQEAESRLLRAFLGKLDSRVVVDVGAERGAFVEAMLAEAEAIHAIEPEPRNATFLRERFQADPSVVVHEVAVGDADGSVVLHRSSVPGGEPLSFGHTILERPATDEIAWGDDVEVAMVSLASLVDAGRIPPSVGILKIDTEGNDLAVVVGMGSLECDVVMVEHWSDLPHSLGHCPWTFEAIASELEPRGFAHYAFLVHRGPSVTLQWDDDRIGRCAMGNLVFVHNRVLDRLLPSVLRLSSELTSDLSALAEERMQLAERRLAMVEDVKQERDRQAAAAEERLTLLHEITSGRQATIERLKRELGRQAQAATERLEAIERLEQERKTLSDVAAERLATIEVLKGESTPGEADAT